MAEGPRVRALTPEEQDQLRLDLASLADATDDHGFILRMSLDDDLSAAVEPLLFGAGRVHVYRRENLDRFSDRIYEFENLIEAVFALGELTVDPDRDPSGWQRCYTERRGWRKASDVDP